MLVGEGARRINANSRDHMSQNAGHLRWSDQTSGDALYSFSKLDMKENCD
jgi:hypothetical protein